jgi:NADPH:quinone reductase
MKAVTFSEFGGPEVLRITEKPDPEPSAGEVVVAVAASTVNPTDLMTLSGLRAPLMRDLTPPYTAGMDFSGHIASAGAGVPGLTPGQPVIGRELATARRWCPGRTYLRTRGIRRAGQGRH